MTVNNNTTKGKDMTNATYTIKATISAERPCDVCGNNRLERNVILADSRDGSTLYVGADCAAQLVYGKKTAANRKSTERVAATLSLAKELLAAGNDSVRVERMVRDRLGNVAFLRQVATGNLAGDSLHPVEKERARHWLETGQL